MLIARNVEMHVLSNAEFHHIVAELLFAGFAAAIGTGDKLYHTYVGGVAQHLRHFYYLCAFMGGVLNSVAAHCHTA